MNYLATEVEQRTPFVANESMWLRVDTMNEFGDHEFWGDPHDSIHINGVNEHWMSYAEGFQSIRLTPGNSKVSIRRQDVPIQWYNVWPGKHTPVRDIENRAVASCEPR